MLLLYLILRKKVVFKAFSFSNSIDGAESLICKLEPFKNQLEIGMEATGHYWLSLYSYLSEKNFTVRVINPSKLMVGDNVLRLEREKLILSILF